MRQFHHQLTVATRGRGFYDLTADVRAAVTRSGFQSGLIVLHVLHTSASLLIQENADPEVRRDLERFFGRLVTDGDRIFRHTAEGEDDMPAHVRAALTAANLTLPILGGRAVLGTWQGIFLWEHRTHGHQRRVAICAMGE